MIVYIAVNCVNNKCYVGHTKQPLDVRKGQHERSAPKRKSAFSAALRKYGTDAFVWYEVERCSTPEDLDQAEIRNIEYFRTRSPYGYNLEGGGNGKKEVSEESRRRMSEAQKGKRLGMTSGAKGYKHTPETLQRITASSTGRRHTESAKQKMRLTTRCKSISLRNLKTGEQVKFHSHAEAGRQLNIHRTSLDQLKLGIIKTTNGWELAK